MTEFSIKELETKNDSKGYVSDDETSTNLLAASDNINTIASVEKGAKLTQAFPGDTKSGFDQRRPVLPGLEIDSSDWHHTTVDTKNGSKETPTAAELIELNIESKEIARQIIKHNDGKFPDGAEREFIRMSLLEASKKSAKHVEYMVRKINEELKAANGKFILGFSYPAENTYPGSMSVAAAHFRLYDTATAKETDSVSIPVVSEGPPPKPKTVDRPEPFPWGPIIRQRPDFPPIRGRIVNHGTEEPTANK